MHELIDILSRVWMIDKQYVDSLMPHLYAYLQGQDISAFFPSSYSTDEKPETYLQKHFKPEALNIASAKVNVTTDYSSDEIHDFSVAYYPMKGVIMADSSWWRFSTMDFVRNFEAAEANPNIIAHFIDARTPGGDTYYLDHAAEIMAAKGKPLVTHFNRVIASAGVYLAAASDKIFATTKFDTVGSVGVMMSMLDMTGIFKKLGAEEHEVYSTLSSMKNKLFTDLRAGNPEEYQKQVLDPLAENFINVVKQNFPNLDTAEEKGALRGATFFANNDPGFLDGICSRAEALQIAYELGRNNSIKNQIS